MAVTALCQFRKTMVLLVGPRTVINTTSGTRISFNGQLHTMQERPGLGNNERKTDPFISTYSAYYEPKSPYQCYENSVCIYFLDLF